MQRVEARLLVFLDPTLVDLVDRDGIEEVQLFASAPLDRDEVRSLEELQMLGDGLSRHVQTTAQSAERLAILGVQPIEQFPTARVGQGFKNVVDRRHGRDPREAWMKCK